MSQGYLLAVLDPNKVKPGWIALILVLILLLVTVLLWRSMNTQLRKIKVPTRQELHERDTKSARPTKQRPPEPSTDESVDPTAESPNDNT
ncbi:MAG: hypothetical protein ACR2KG_02205 [Nocardioidaceae bacterium]